MSHHWSDLMTRAGVGANVTLVLATAARLGGIPPLLQPKDFTAARSVDDRAMVMFLAYLCSRLLEVSAEERAAHVLQSMWRSRCQRLPGAAAAAVLA